MSPTATTAPIETHPTVGHSDADADATGQGASHDVASLPNYVKATAHSSSAFPIHDRCQVPTVVGQGMSPAKNACGAAPFVRVTYPLDIVTFYCGHHYTAIETKLTTSGALEIYDARHLINAKPSPSS